MAIQAPNFCKDAVPTKKGWCHPRTGELLKSQRITEEQINEWHGVTEEPVVEAAPEPIVVEEPVVEEDTCDHANMTKRELQQHALEVHGVELDLKLSKVKMLEQFEELTQS
jgi:hypothetical protein